MSRFIAGPLRQRLAPSRLERSRLLIIRTVGLAASICGLIVAMASEVSAVFPFPRPASIEPNIKFWVDVFTAYGERDFIILDRDKVWRIYQVLHLPGEGSPSRAEVDAVNGYLKGKFFNLLNRLASGQPPATYEEVQVAKLFQGEPLSAYAAAAQNLRVQQ